MGRFWDNIKEDLSRAEEVLEAEYAADRPHDSFGHELPAREMRFGVDYDTNAAIVRQVQQAVNAAGYQPQLAVDGSYGPLTAAGIRWLQGMKGLAQDGVIGDQTLAALGIKPATSGPNAPVNWARAYATAAAALRQAAQKHGYPPPSDQLLKWMIGQVMAESNLGLASTVAGTNNWGAYQATPAWLQSHAGQPGYGAIAYHDSSPGPPARDYIGFLRVLPSQGAAADDWFARWGTILMTGGEPASATDYATRLYQHGYFEGFHGPARPIGQRSLPLTDPEQQNVNDYVGFMSSHAVDISGPADDPNKVSYVGRPAPIAHRLMPKYGTDFQSMVSSVMGQWGSLLGGSSDFFTSGDGIIWATGKAPPQWLGVQSPLAILASAMKNKKRTAGIAALVLAFVGGLFALLYPKARGPKALPPGKST